MSDGGIDEELERAMADFLNAFAEWLFARFTQVTSNPAPKEDRQEVYGVSILKVRQLDHY